MSYVPRTVWVDRPVPKPRPVKSKYLKGHAGYVKYANSSVAHHLMNLVCEQPGMTAAEIMARSKNKSAYGYIDCLVRDGYARVTTDRNAHNVPIMRVWPTELFLAMFPRNL